MREQTDRRPRTRTDPAPAQMPETEEAVEAHWPPLTPEHGFPSHTVTPDSGRSPSVRCGTPPQKGTRHPPQNSKISHNKKQETPSAASPAKNHDDDFLRRHYPHQVKGRSCFASSQPAVTSSPVFDCDCILHPLPEKCKGLASGRLFGLACFGRITRSHVRWVGRAL